MKNPILAAVLVAASATVATSAFAGGYDATPAVTATQANPSLTRAEVRAQLVAIEQAGYQPYRGTDNSYPSDVQAAQARISAQADTSGYGAATQGTSQAGQPVAQ